ncbi:SPL family radical SAM protein [Thermococcus gammatolerans]|uniref:Radical SAM protein, elongator protein 3/MiaB/NifB related n=1 Tax=Thermococcus gammatolerans (strain DSM 15229 / JCM 11827 / EJ3) TaxID=593117 RepID=C5A5P8_THEGJ|nr:radical SAM protein [Thermococcus gammatolerans]ACS33560.1 Radical SAM protein, elongator protein 3/MiaB/NifB related [Thermococcus gammatolerans EJ3]
MSYIRPFDPWKSKLCTCPFKYTLNVYTGCDHACVYCYITSYIPNAFRVRTKENLLPKLERELRKFDGRHIIALSYSSDPYPTIERELGITRKVLELFRRYDVRCLLLTKSDIFERDIDVLSELRCAVGITVTTVDERKARLLEPNAPSPKERIRALKKAKKAGIPVYARIDPIIPFYTWDDFEKTVEALNFVSHVTVSTLKLRPDSKRRMFAKFPDLMEKLWPLYERGERIGGYHYLPREVRFEILRKAEREITKRGMTFGSCREGYHSYPSCDGSHLVP